MLPMAAFEAIALKVDLVFEGFEEGRIRYTLRGVAKKPVTGKHLEENFGSPQTNDLSKRGLSFAPDNRQLPILDARCRNGNDVSLD